MKIGDRTISRDEPPYVIAEIGVNHDGSAERAHDLIDEAAAAGASAVKLQFFEAERLLSRAARSAQYQQASGDDDPLAMLRRLELTPAVLRHLRDHAAGNGIHFILSVFSVELVDAAREIGCDALKTASPDLINRPLLEALATTGRPLIVSTGAATADEVLIAAEWLHDAPRLFLHCVSAYPAPINQTALGGIRALERLLSEPAGYSDHTAVADTGALAVAAGAVALEKHLTYDRRAKGPDHAASLDPPAFAEYIALAQRAWTMCGRDEKRLLDIEQDVRDASRQSLTALRDLPAGAVIQRGDVTIKRPGGGISPARLEEVVGRTLARHVRADMPLLEGDVR